MKKAQPYILFLNILLSFLFVHVANAAEAAIKLAPLPYKKSALEPYISLKTMTYHYDKHHQGYVDTLNKMLDEKKVHPKSLDEVIELTAHDDAMQPMFNQAAQIWNHTFYWNSMREKGGGEPVGMIRIMINKAFGSYENFKKLFIEAGQKQFGSGWVWLILDKDGALKIISTSNADLPTIHGQTALLACDVWEHAYYLDYQNRRKDYVQVFLDHLVNWEFANKNLPKTEIVKK